MKGNNLTGKKRVSVALGGGRPDRIPIVPVYAGTPIMPPNAMLEAVDFYFSEARRLGGYGVPPGHTVSLCAEPTWQHGSFASRQLLTLPITKKMGFNRLKYPPEELDTSISS